jgi:photosystem II stability/assembly factor-like uncharacterized protein
MSTDGGETWTKFTDALQSFDVVGVYATPLGISPVNPEIMFGQSAQGIVKSVDRGKHWEPVGQQALISAAPRSVEERKTGRRIVGGRLGFGVVAKQFVFSPSDESVLYIVSNKGVYRTLDGGLHWCLLDLGFDVVDSYNNAALSPTDTKELFVGTAYGLFRSRDRGCHFERIYPGEKPSTITTGDAKRSARKQ